MQRRALFSLLLMVSVAACSPADSPTGSPSDAAGETGCAAQLARGERHYELIRAELSGEIIDLAGSGAGLSAGYDAPDAFGALVGGFDAENLALYGAPGVILMSGGWRDESASRTGWFMGVTFGEEALKSGSAISAPEGFADCALFTPPLTSSLEFDSAALAELGAVHRVFASFLSSQRGNPYIESDPLSGAMTLYWSDELTFLIAERPDGVSRD